MSKEALNLALEALENNRQTHHYCEDTWYSCPKHEEGCANESEGDECNCGADKANAEIDYTITAIKEALAQPEPWEKFCDSNCVWTDHHPDCKLAQPQQEPVAKPYAYEYGRDNGDGTYCIVIEKGDLIQTAPAVYNYVHPRNHHKDWPVKELFDRAPPQRNPLTDEQWQQIADITNTILTRHTKEKIEAVIGIKE